MKYSDHDEDGMITTKHILLTLIVILITSAWATRADAFCGMYIATEEDRELLNDATQVVLYRDGTLTGITMRNNYHGKPEEFAMIIPVTEVLSPQQVYTIDHQRFDRIATYTSPRLVKYQRKDVCYPERGGSILYEEHVQKPTTRADLNVRVKNAFSVAEYELVILEASQSTNLLTWLELEGYHVPKKGADIIQGYIHEGMYFMVARINPNKLTFDERGHAVLSPLHFSYHSEDFKLPIRLGTVNSESSQDVLIHIVSKNGRYDIANYPSAPVATNLIVDASTQENFPLFYRELTNHQRTTKKLTALTEFVGIWSTPGLSTCDPCTLVNPALEDDLLVDLRDRSSFPTKVEMDFKLIDPYADESLTLIYRLMPEHRLHMRFLASNFLEDKPFLWHVRYDFIKHEEDDDSWRIFRRQVVAGDEQPLHFDGWATEYAKYAASELKPEGNLFTVDVIWHNRKVLDMRQLSPYSHTVTRLHARIPKDATEDLIFTTAPFLKGGTGTPDHVTGKIGTKTTHDEAHQYSTFQARYMILDEELVPFDESKTCGEGQHIKRIWSSPQNKRASASMPGRLMSMEKKATGSLDLQKMILNVEDSSLSF